MNQIARELALDLGDAAFKPDLLSHTPGVASSIADVLSRKFSPVSKFDVPDILRGALKFFRVKRPKLVEVPLKRPKYSGICGPLFVSGVTALRR